MRLQIIIGCFLLFLLGLAKLSFSDVALVETWRGIYSGENKIGYSRIIRKTIDEGEEIIEQSKLRMKLLGSEQDVDVKSKYLLNGIILKSFEFMMNAGLVELKLIGQREGNNFRINMSSVSGTSEFTYPIEEEPVVSPILFKWLVEQNPNVGETYEVLLLDPVSIIFGVEPQKLKATLRVEGQEQVKIPLGNFMTYRIKMNYMDSESTTWITHDGEIVKEVSPLGLVSYKENENGLGNQDLTGFDIIKKTAISSNVKLKNPRDLILMRIKIEGISKMKGLNVIDNNRQFIRDGIIEIKVSDLSSINPYEIPYKGDEYRSYTEQSNLIQSRNLAIQNQATDIIDHETNSVEAARKINDWVYNYLEKTPTVSIPNALDVLKTRKGDCNEHATLFAALTRAAGIPTKLALGLVLLDDKFYYHAWNEVFVGKWVAVDPTFGQFPADASHIKFIEGDLSRSAEILKVVGNINLEVIEAS